MIQQNDLHHQRSPIENNDLGTTPECQRSPIENNDLAEQPASPKIARGEPPGRPCKTAITVMEDGGDDVLEVDLSGGDLRGVRISNLSTKSCTEPIKRFN
jgi:hypothetical protein